MDAALRAGRLMLVLIGLGSVVYFSRWAVETWAGMFVDEGGESGASLYLLMGLFPATFALAGAWLAIAAIRGDADRTLILFSILLTYVLLVGGARLLS